jgi:hypothetical protein
MIRKEHKSSVRKKIGLSIRREKVSIPKEFIRSASRVFMKIPSI